MLITSENLFRLIFHTQINIHIHIRCFKSLPIATYCLTTIHIKNLYLHSKTYDMAWNEIYIWRHFPPAAQSIRQSQTSLISIWQKQ